MLRTDRAKYLLYTFFIASVAIAWRPAVFVDERIILYWYYGPERVEGEHLRIVGHEGRAIRTSNGEVVGKDHDRARGFLNFVTITSMIAILFASMLFLVRLVAPRLCRELCYCLRPQGDDPFVRELVE